MPIDNWYLTKNEQKVEDRAAHGEQLLKLNDLIAAIGAKGLPKPNFKISRQFYLINPESGQTVSDFLQHRWDQNIGQTPSEL